MPEICNISLWPIPAMSKVAAKQAANKVPYQSPT